MSKTFHSCKLISALLAVLMLISLIPVYAADSFTVTFLIPKADGSTEQYQIEVIQGNAIGESNMPAAPELPTRSFDGWYCKGVEVTAETIPTEDMYVAAKFSEKGTSFKVVFYVPDADSGDATAVEVNVPENTAIGAENIPNVPAIDGKYFIGWFSAGNEVTADTIPESDMNVYAKYGTYSKIEISEIAPISNVANGADLENIGLPESVEITLPDGSKYTAGIEWDLVNADYNKSSKYEQSFKLYGRLTALPEGIVPEDDTVSIDITVIAAKKKPHIEVADTEFIVTSSAGEGGTIIPSGENSVKRGAKITFTIAANEGYEIKTITVNGEEIEPTEEYTFKRVYSDQSISVTFAKSKAAEETVIPTETDEKEPDTDTKVNPFTDVSESDSYYDAVSFVYENDLFKGTSETEFSPMVTMSRAMFVTVLGRLAKVDVNSYTEASFNDVAADSYYAKYVTWAAEKGIANGYGEGIFGPDDEVTIEQAIVFIARFAKLYGIETTESDIDFSAWSDINNVSEWSMLEVLWALENKIYSPENQMLNPQGAAARYIVAEMLCNFCNAYETDNR